MAHQAPPSLGFSRQEHWSGLPFPSPMHEVKSESEVTQSCLTLSDPMDCSLPGSSVHGIFQARVLEWGVIAFSRENPNRTIFSPIGSSSPELRPLGVQVGNSSPHLCLKSRRSSSEALTLTLTFFLALFNVCSSSLHPSVSPSLFLIFLHNWIVSILQKQ